MSKDEFVRLRYPCALAGVGFAVSSQHGRYF